MSESVNLPALGESVTEGTVTRWLKQVGDRVEVDEPLLEVSTDKVDTEIPSPVAGVIEAILVQEDETVEVGTALVTIGDGSGGGDAPAEAPQQEAAPQQQEAAPQQVAPQEAAPQQVTAPQPADAQPAAPQPVPEQQPAQAQSGEGYETPSLEQEVAPQAQEQPQQPAPQQQEQPQQAAPQQPQPQSAPASSEPNPGALPSDPNPSADAEVPSNEAPRPEEQAAAHAPAPADQVDPAPAVQQQNPPAAQQPPTAPATPPAPSAPAAPAPSAPAAAPAAAPDASAYITPIVRKLANDRGVDLGTIQGTGVGGRIRKQDVLDASPSAPAAGDAAAPVTPKTKAEPSPLRGTTVPMSRLRKVVAERAVVSMQSSAQLTSVVEVDVTAVAKLRDEVKGTFQQKTGTKLSFLPFFGIAAAEALRTYPIINATVDGDSIVYPATENVSIAVDTERGLLTPVVRDAGELDIAGWSAQIADLAQRTRDNKLKPDELAGGTFTLTNTGSRGALFDTPLVFLPQVAILGTGIVTKRPVVIEGDAIAIRSMVYLALSYDHRIVDGADAARFLVAVKDRLEAGDFGGDLGI
jgi:pyruvate dehydrogenase E2 component (dihydrolipoamide acetyltransferase)